MPRNPGQAATRPAARPHSNHAAGALRRPGPAEMTGTATPGGDGGD